MPITLRAQRAFIQALNFPASPKVESEERVTSNLVIHSPNGRS